MRLDRLDRFRARDRPRRLKALSPAVVITPDATAADAAG